MTVLDPEALRASLLRQIENRYVAEGQLALPAVPALRDHYLALLADHAANLARPLDPSQRASLQTLLGQKLEEAYAAAPQSSVVVRYRVERLSAAPIMFTITSAKRTLADEYDDWVSSRNGSLFGKHPDAKVMDLARALGEATPVRVLDVGAGTGRNTLPLARAGCRTVAVEIAPSLADVLADELDRVGRDHKGTLDVQVVCGDILDEALAVPLAPFDLVVVAEVVPHLRNEVELRRLFTRLAGLAREGGLLLVSVFLAADAYRPDELARQVAQVQWSSFFTRDELAAALADLPWENVSDEPVLAYERAHLPPTAWPPTSWFESWASGTDAFGTARGEAPMDLRWLVYRKRGA
ncbi:MAG: methyltransferase domain-containing protein [Minicystis sp.]